MAVANSPLYPENVNTFGLYGGLELTNAAYTLVELASVNWSDIISLKATSTDTVDRVIQLFARNATTDYLLATFSVPANSGNSTSVPAVNLLTSSQLPVNYDSNGSRFLRLNVLGVSAPTVSSLSVSSTTAPTAGKVIAITSLMLDYRF